MEKAGSSPSSSTISVVIPAYNASGTIARCLEGIFRCDPPPFEVVVVDDGSEDDTVTLANGFPCTVVPMEENRGPAAAKNRGARQARGEILLFVDADVVLPPDAIAIVAGIFENHAEVHGVQGIYSTDEIGESVFSIFQQFYYSYYFQRISENYVHIVSTWTVALRAESLRAAGGFNESYPRPTAEDEELGYRFGRLGYAIWLAKDLRVVHLIHYSFSAFCKRKFRMVEAQIKMVLRNRKYLKTMTSNKSHHDPLVLASLVLTPLWLVAMALSAVLPTPFATWAWGGSFAALTLIAIMNLGFWRFVASRRGRKTGLGVAAVTLVDYVVMACGILWGGAGYLLLGRRY